MKLLQEMKGVRYTLDQVLYYSYQQYIRSEGSPLCGQPTVLSMFRAQKRGAPVQSSGQAHGPVEVMTRKVGVLRSAICVIAEHARAFSVV